MHVDFVIITALEEERDAVLNKLPKYEKVAPSETDIRVYFRALLPVTYPDGSAHSYSIIVLCLLGMGRVEALNGKGRDKSLEAHLRLVGRNRRRN